MCCVIQGPQTGALWQAEGWNAEGDGTDVQEGGDVCVPMVDSCWYVTENHKILFIFMPMKDFEIKKKFKER